LTLQRQAGFWIGALALRVASPWLFQDIPLPFIAGFALAYFLDPVADRLERLGLPRLAATLVMLAVALSMVLSVPFWLLAAHFVQLDESDQVHFLGAYKKQLVSVAANYVNDFRTKNGRPPNAEEFWAWMRTQSSNYPGYEQFAFSYQTSPFESALVEQFGAPPREAFVLTFREDDATIVYAPWIGSNGQSYVENADFFTWGSKTTDVAIFSGIALGLSSPAIFVLFAWVRRRGKNQLSEGRQSCNF